MRSRAVLTFLCGVAALVTALVLTDQTNAGAGQTGCPVSESGVLIGYGVGNIPEGKYRPMLMAWHIGFNLKEYSSDVPGDRMNAISFFLEPQVNPSFSPATDIECGVGFGLKYRYYLTEKMSAYCMASIGPHWITLQTKDQANGFLFSDMIGVGLSFFVTERSIINLELRGRHLSNAGLELPNKGINSCFGVVGYSVFF